MNRVQLDKSNNIQMLISKMLQENPINRITTTQIINYLALISQ